jgi:integrase
MGAERVERGRFRKGAAPRGAAIDTPTIAPQIVLLATGQTASGPTVRAPATGSAGWEDEGDHLLTHAVYFTKPPRHGVPVRPDWVTMAFRRLVDGSGLPDLNLHGLRHSWATAAYDAGEPLRAVSDHLGHADTSITDRIYTHAVRRVQDATALRVAALITSKRGAGR